MGKCKNCKHWDTELDGNYKPCDNPLIVSSSEFDHDALVWYGGDDGYCDHFTPSGEFGCILFEVVDPNEVAE